MAKDYLKRLYKNSYARYMGEVYYVVGAPVDRVSTVDMKGTAILAR